jgi:hypothetical protein
MKVWRVERFFGDWVVYSPGDDLPLPVATYLWRWSAWRDAKRRAQRDGGRAELRLSFPRHAQTDEKGQP